MPAPAITKFGGNVRLYRKNSDGSLTPAIPSATDVDGNQPIEANAMVLTRDEGEKTTIKSKQRGNRFGQPVYSEQEPGTSKLALTLLEVPPMIMARVMFGQAATQQAIVAGSTVDESVLVATLDRPLQLGKRYLDDTVPVTATLDAVPLVEGTDFVVDYRRGQIRFLAAGAVVKDDTVLVSSTHLAHTQTVIDGGGVPTETFYITGDMENRVTNAQGELEIYEAKLAVDGELDLLGDEPISPTLSGDLIVPSDQNAPYRFTEYSL